MTGTKFIPFGVKLRDLLQERGITTGMGNANFKAFAELLPTVHYETLRKQVSGERPVGIDTMRESAEALHVPPQTFNEYALWEAQREFDPAEVGFEQALANLEAWVSSRRRSGKR
jgi:transcriptional regulator with XRE-family HTH domain